jgi:hypothetical protein
MDITASTAWPSCRRRPAKLAGNLLAATMLATLLAAMLYWIKS